MGGEELGLLYVDGLSGFGEGDNEVGLSAKEGRQLEDVYDLGGGGCLSRFVNVGDHGHAVGLLDLREYLEAFFQSGTAKGGYGRAVCLVEGGLEHIGDAELGGDFLVGGGDFQCELSRLEDVHAPEKNEGAIVGYGDAGDVDGLLFVHPSERSGADPCSARTFMAMPPLALKRASTSHQRGERAATRSSSRRLAKCSWKTPSSRKVQR